MGRFWNLAITQVIAVTCLALLLFPGYALAQSTPLPSSAVVSSSTVMLQVQSVSTGADETGTEYRESLASSGIDAPVLFEQNCAGCHVGGGNIIRRGKNLKSKALKRYGMDSHGAIVNIITNGKGTMSAYGEEAEFGAPTRLNSDEIEALADYVLAQAANGWK